MRRAIKNRALVTMTAIGVIGSICLMVFSPLLVNGQNEQTGSVSPPAYWIWAGIPSHAAPMGSEILIYQGLIKKVHNHWQFEPRGLAPHPLTNLRQTHSTLRLSNCALTKSAENRPISDQPTPNGTTRKIHLVFRLHELPEPEFLVQIIQTQIKAWQYHHVPITGVQLDFDSPSAALETYAQFLAQFKQQMKHGVNPVLSLSITGLGAWLAETQVATLAAIHGAVDHVTYQLYVGRRAIQHIDYYIAFLSQLGFDFKVGLLVSQAKLAKLKPVTNNEFFKGYVYFIQN